MQEQPYICIFSALYKPSAGGVEIFTENLAHKLVDLGYRVLIVTSNTHGLPADSVEEGVRIMRLPSRGLMGGRLPLPDKNDVYKAMVEEIERLPIDRMLINTRLYSHSRVGAQIAKCKGIKPVLLDHGSAYITMGNPLADAMLRVYEHGITAKLKSYDIDYYGISHASANWLQTFGIKAKGTLTNALDPTAFIEGASDRNFAEELNLPNDAFVVAFTGRLVPEKGIMELISAAEVLEEHPKIHILLAGNGPLLPAVRESKANIYALGAMSRNDIAALLLQADAFCLPTRSEGFSTSLLEAASCGCAPIITNVGGVSELIPDDSFGTIIPDREPQTIANAILELAHDPAACNAIGQHIAAHADMDFTWDKTAADVIAALDKASARVSSN